MTSHDNVTDIVERLRKADAVNFPMRTQDDCHEAADTIATLRKQLENAREAERQYKRIFAEMTRTKALKGQP